MVFDGSTLDLYSVLVEMIFGSILASGVAMAVALAIIGMLSRMSPLLIIFIIALFVLVFGTGYAGSIVAGIAFFFALMYFMIGLLNAVNARQYFG